MEYLLTNSIPSSVHMNQFAEYLAKRVSENSFNAVLDEMIEVARKDINEMPLDFKQHYFDLQNVFGANILRSFLKETLQTLLSRVRTKEPNNDAHNFDLQFSGGDEYKPLKEILVGLTSCWYVFYLEKLTDYLTEKHGSLDQSTIDTLDWLDSILSEWHETECECVWDWVEPISISVTYPPPTQDSSEYLRLKTNLMRFEEAMKRKIF